MAFWVFIKAIIYCVAFPALVYCFGVWDFGCVIGVKKKEHIMPSNLIILVEVKVNIFL